MGLSGPTEATNSELKSVNWSAMRGVLACGKPDSLEELRKVSWRRWNFIRWIIKISKAGEGRAVHGGVRSTQTRIHWHGPFSEIYSPQESTLAQ